jgi:hypothetical protein
MYRNGAHSARSRAGPLLLRVTRDRINHHKRPVMRRAAAEVRGDIECAVALERERLRARWQEALQARLGGASRGAHETSIRLRGSTRRPT